MEYSLFLKITRKLDEEIARCENIKKSIDRFNDLTIIEYNNLVSESRESQRSMDLILTSDIYHLIGMGQLSDIQTLVLINQIKEYCSYRNTIKTASGLSTVEKPVIQSSSKYKSKIFDCTLKVEKESS